MIDDCTAIILAGGNSQRMGSDKASLMLNGRSLLDSVAATMERLFPHVVLSVRRLRTDTDLPQVCDDAAYAGPLAGLVSGMESISTPWAFVVACDMPFVAAEMVDLLALRRGTYQAVVPVTHGYPQPLAAFYARSGLEEIRTHMLSGGKHSMRAVLEKLHVCYVREPELRKADEMLRCFVDLDTPAEYARELNNRGFGV
ncbi:MAG: molybdenum cofactor guanylyltransferase [Gallionella sp.]